MKNRQLFTVLTLLLAAVFILSQFSGSAVAQQPINQTGNQPLRGQYENTGKQFEDAKQQFENALRQFNAKKDNKSNEELVLKTQEYLEKAIDHMISYLDILKSRVETPENQGIFPFDVSKNIDSQVTELEQLKTKVQQDNTTDELRADNKELMNVYAGIRLEARYNYEILLNNTIGKFIAKSDNVSARLNAAIQNLKSNGKDTSSLEAIATNFTNSMQGATAGQQKTEALLATHTGFNDSGMVINNTDAQAFLKQIDDSQRETIKVLRDASGQLQVFVRDYKRLSGGSAVTGRSGVQQNERDKRTLIMGSGTLVANGTGRAVIEGNVTVTLSGINGTLMASNNAVVIADGGTNQTLRGGQVKYQGFNSATITGNNIIIEVSGNNIDLTASGTGAAILNGNGTYRTEDNFSVSGGWKKED